VGAVVPAVVGGDDEDEALAERPAGATAAGAACGAPHDAPALAGPFTTDATAYVAHRTAEPRGPQGYRCGFTAVARYTNPRARPVRLD
jgi:ketosteroid isomerase-like protein